MSAAFLGIENEHLSMHAQWKPQLRTDVPRISIFLCLPAARQFLTLKMSQMPQSVGLGTRRRKQRVYYLPSKGIPRSGGKTVAHTPSIPPWTPEDNAEIPCALFCNTSLPSTIEVMRRSPRPWPTLFLSTLFSFISLDTKHTQPLHSIPYHREVKGWVCRA